MEELNSDQPASIHIDETPLLTTNSSHARWMTNIGSDIEHLKIQDLILAEAHNAGVDQKRTDWIGYRWAACQDDTFAYQLNNGIRALDLRLYSHGTSYIFKHSGYHASRELNRCLDEVSEFATANPGEIVIMDLREVVVDGREAGVASALQLRIGDLCIPPTARTLTIGQIRTRFPGRNVVIAWNYPLWFCWERINQTWTGNDFNSVHALNNHIISIMLDPPTNQLWSIFAAGYDLAGPMRLNPNNTLWKSFFSKVSSANYRQPCKGNMINVDFFAGTGVIDRCITATRERANNARLSTPTQLIASNITNNSIRLSWSRPQDAEAITGYSLYANEKFFSRTTNTFFVFSGLMEGTLHHLQVVPHYASGIGATAEITAVTVDATKPSRPSNLNFMFIDILQSALLRWTPSTDNVAVTRYEIYGNQRLLATLDANRTSYSCNRTELITYKVRALDAAGNFADSDPITMPADQLRPTKPANFRATSVTNNAVTLEWVPSRDNVAVSGYQIYRNDIPTATVNSTVHIDRGLSDGSYVYKVRALNSVGNFADSDPITVKIDGLPPSKPTNLRAVNAMSTTIVLWDASSDNTKVDRYEVYRNGKQLGTAATRPANPQVFETEDLVAPSSFMVRALDAAGNYADSDLLIRP